jgi:hypothetical protein
VGNEVKELGKDLKHAYEISVLKISNASAAAAFTEAWVYRISTTLQQDTAEIVYGVTQGEKAPMSAARMAKDQQVVEAVLHDKDPEWFQTQGTGHSSTARITRRQGQGQCDAHNPTCEGPGRGGGLACRVETQLYIVEVGVAIVTCPSPQGDAAIVVDWYLFLCLCQVDF